MNFLPSLLLLDVLRGSEPDAELSKDAVSSVVNFDPGTFTSSQAVGPQQRFRLQCRGMEEGERKNS